MPVPGGKPHKGSSAAANSRPAGAGPPSWRDRRDCDIVPLRLPPVASMVRAAAGRRNRFSPAPGPFQLATRAVARTSHGRSQSESGLRNLRLDRTSTSAWRRGRSLAGPPALPPPARCSDAEDRPRWLSLHGRNPQAAQKPWQWPRFVGTGQHQADPVIDEPTFRAQSSNFLYAQFKAPSITDSWCVCLITSNDHEPLIAHPGSMTQTVAFTEMIMGNPAAASPPRESRPPYWP